MDSSLSEIDGYSETHEHATNILAHERGSIVLPAGFGKTFLIAATASRAIDNGERVLVLTHTNAGVASLRTKLTRFSVSRSACVVSTIDGWLKRFSDSYPGLGGSVTAHPDGRINWSAVHSAAAAALDNPHVRRVMDRSFDFVIVDEVQDCGKKQLALIRTIAESSRLSLFGDPLQSVFDFDEDRLDWSSDFEDFESVDIATGPWRWAGKNEELGRDIMCLREAIEGKSSFEFAGTSFEIHPHGDRPNLTPCWRLTKPPIETGVVLCRWPRQALNAAKQLKGTFNMMEEIEGRDLRAAATAVDRGNGVPVAFAMAKFVSDSYSNLPPAFGSKRNALENGTFPGFRAGKLHAFLLALRELVDAPGPAEVEAVLREAIALNGTCVRKEAWHEMDQSVRAWKAGEYPTLAECVQAARDRTSVLGRKAYRRSVSRVLLVKGLEFDGCVLLQRDMSELTPQEIYVAFSRPCFSMAVITDDVELDFSNADVAGIHH